MPKGFDSADVRNRYGRFAGEPDALQLATCFHLDDADMDLLVTKATLANRLGLALLLGCVRFLGAFAPDLATVPASIVAYVAGQIGVDDVAVPAGYGRGGTNARHRQLICHHDGYRDLHNPLVALDLARWLTERAWMADKRPEVLFDLATARLRQRRPHDNVDDSAVRSAVFARVPAERIEAAVVTIEALAHRTAAGALERLAGSYPTLRRWLPGVLAHLELDANEAGRPVLDAWEFLRAIEGRRGPDMRQAPVEVVRGAWRDLVWDEERRVSRTFYTWCVLDRLQDALRRRDVFVPGSLDWGDPRAQLLQGAAWIAARGHVCRSLELPDRAADALDRLRTALDEAYTEAERSLSDEDLAWITSHRGRDTVAIGRFEKLPKSPSLTALHDRVADALPLVDLSELLLEVNAWTGFADAIGQGPGAHPRAPHLAQSVAAVLLADACNIGLAAVADPTERALGADRLAWVRQHYVGAEAIVEANGRLVDVHAELPLARHWGGGHVASADGLRFVVAGRSADAAPNSRYFGLGRGVTYYNFVSDQHTGFHAVVVPGTLRDSLFVLDGLLEHRTRLEPAELMTDTAGYGDVVFGLFWLLGYQFSPRLRDIRDMRYWRLDRAAHYGRLNTVAHHVVRPERIERHWRGSPADCRPSQARHGPGIGPDADTAGRRPRVPAPPGNRRSGPDRKDAVPSGLHLRHRLPPPDACPAQPGREPATQWHGQFFGRRGQLRQPYRLGQENQLGALGLVVNAIALWNTVYMSDALSALAAEGERPNPADVARPSPMLHAHVNVIGHYRFELPAPVAAGHHRAIRLPDNRPAPPRPR